MRVIEEIPQEAASTRLKLYAKGELTRKIAA